MSVYSAKRRGWRYDFTLNGARHTGAGFKTKTEAKAAEAQRREEILNPEPPEQEQEALIPTDMAFLDLVNARLDYVKAYNSQRHYTDHLYTAKRWIKHWGKLNCSQIRTDMIQDYLLKRRRRWSALTANKDLRLLRALFNFGAQPTRNWIETNPTRGIAFFPVDKKIKYVPCREDVLRVILAADPEVQDYLWTIALTMGRMSEINNLTWQEVNLERRYVVLYTRKKRGGHLTPRTIPMCERLYDVLSRRFKRRDNSKPWVFWHRYWDRFKKEWVEGPYNNRRRIMKTLCEKAGVRYFRFHVLRHFGASMLDQSGVPIGSIQRILGHENRSTTEIYLHSIGDYEREAMDVLNDGFENFSHTNSHTTKKGITAMKL